MQIQTYLRYFLFILLSILLGINFAQAQTIDYREAMRAFVIKIANHARASNASFIVIPQNGLPLITDSGNPDGSLAADYANTINGTGIESLYYGFLRGDIKTSPQTQQPMLALANVFKANGKTVMVTDYCVTRKKVDASYTSNNNAGFISFASTVSLTTIPKYPAQPYNTNTRNINSMTDASNFLYLINSKKFKNKQAMLGAISNTDYDMIVIDLFFEDEMLTADDINSLKTKKSGGRRLVISYMSIGEAESYRYYWNNDWLKKATRPTWLKALNPRWPGNYKVEYWNQDWQSIIVDGNDAYLDRILHAGFDGAYLDIIDAYEYFESLNQ